MKLLPEETDFIDIHSHHTESEEGIFRIYNVFSSDFPQISKDRPVSIGLHPWHLSEKAILDLPAVMKQSLKLKNVLAIGEAGLDKIIKTPIRDQLAVFRTQIEAGIEHNKPLIIHCVKAFPELLNLRKEYRDVTPWIIHGFNANQTVASECIKMGIFISLSQRLFRNPEKALKIVNAVPLSMVFTETDDGTLPIREVYDSIANLYGKSLSELKREIYINFIRIFQNSEEK
jgi:TatD DNase family protein